MSLLLTTTATVQINDLDGRVFTHPVVDFDLLSDYSMDDIVSSQELQDALDAGTITLRTLDTNIEDISVQLSQALVDDQVYGDTLTAASDTLKIDENRKYAKYGPMVNDGITEVNGALILI